MNPQQQQQQRLAAIGTDKELSDLLDFSAVGPARVAGAAPHPGPPRATPLRSRVSLSLPSPRCRCSRRP